MNRFSVNHNHVTNDSMTKAGNVRGMCNIFLLFKMTVCRQSSSQNYTKKGKKHYFIRERLDFISQGSFLQEK